VNKNRLVIPQNLNRIQSNLVMIEDHVQKVIFMLYVIASICNYFTYNAVAARGLLGRTDKHIICHLTFHAPFTTSKKFGFLRKRFNCSVIHITTKKFKNTTITFNSINFHR